VTSLALISDIHGNLPALEAVAADIRQRRPDAVYVLGDIVNGCAWPAEVMDMLAAEGWPSLMGNHDDAVLQLGTSRMETRYADRSRYALLWWTRDHLKAAQLRILAGLPLERPLSFPDAPSARLVHGVPGNFFVGIRPDSPEPWTRQVLSGVSEGVIAGGHTHVPLVGRVERWLFVNTGSVGAPYDGDWRPSYAWLEGDREGWRAEVVRLEYNRTLVAQGYRESGLGDAGGVLGEMFHRTVMTGEPWVSDFAWWIREQPSEAVADARQALRLYDAQHGPGRWAFPLPK
jgi:predicted phosphodiesterase